MKLCLKILAIVIIAAFAYSVIGCAAPATFSYQSVTLSLTFTPCAANCPVVTYNASAPNVIMVAGPNGQGCLNLYATVTNAPPNISWTLYPTPSLVVPHPLPSGTSYPVGESGSPIGTINYANGTTNFFCPPSALPVYTGAALLQAQALGIPQGDILLVAGVPSDPSVPASSCIAPGVAGCVITEQMFQIYNSTSGTGPPTVTLFPSTPSGNTNSAVTVARNTSFQFNGFAVGAPPCTPVAACLIQGVQYPLDYTDNKVNWLVGSSPATATPCTVASLCPYGTVSSTGLYTAPATIPSTQPVVIAVSDLVSTITAAAYLTVN
jgi:hypothetical protein